MGYLWDKTLVDSVHYHVLLQVCVPQLRIQLRRHL
jgi:hypothetical protein